MAAACFCVRWVLFWAPAAFFWGRRTRHGHRCETTAARPHRDRTSRFFSLHGLRVRIKLPAFGGLAKSPIPRCPDNSLYRYASV